jgi:hypothetical protein
MFNVVGAIVDEVRAREGGGSVFAFIVPLRQQTARAERPSQRPSLPG